jgi:hypothetical protein
MFQKETFGTTDAQNKLSALKGVIAFPEGGKISEVNDALEKVKYSLQIHGAAPKYVLTRALYPTVEGGDILASARFVVRPAVHSELEVADLKKVFTINAGADFFEKFIQELAHWFDVYQYHKQLQVNVDALNAEFATVIEENEIPFTVAFSLGNGLLDASDSHAVIGLSADVISSVGELALFDANMESRKVGYKARIVETLKQSTKAYDIVKVKSNVTKDLGIYSRRKLNKLMRKFVNRNVEFVRVGTGYVETEEFFAVVDKIAVTEEQLVNIDVTNSVVIDNVGASSKEKEAGKVKIVATYRVSPFDKETGVPFNKELAEIVK